MLANWIIVVAVICFFAGVIGSVVLAVDQAQKPDCSLNEIVLDEVCDEDKTVTDAAILVGIAVAGIFTTVVSTILLLAVANGLFLLERIAQSLVRKE
jgi:hypothetical protein